MNGPLASHVRVRLKYRAQVDMGQSPPSAEYSLSPEDGLPFLQGTADFGGTHPVARVYCGTPTKIAAKGDILFSVRAPVGDLNIADQRVGIGRGLCAIRPGATWAPRFAWWAIHQARHQLNYVSTGSTYEAVSADDVANMSVEDPPFAEQCAIADYLDRETARLDALVAAKERLLALLAEKRRALITRAVTRGLDKAAPLRDSGIPWLGEIPVDWRTAGFTKYLKSLVDYRGKTPEKTPSGVFLVTARNIRDGRIDYQVSQEFVHLDAYEDVMQRGRPSIGDLLLTTEAPLGQAALVDRTDIALAQRVIKLDYDGAVLLNEFALQWIASSPFQWQLHSFATGSTALGIKGERLHMLRNLLPPIKEQRAIVAYIEQETARLDALRLATERTIALLKERRAALIAAAVTGQICVQPAVG